MVHLAPGVHISMAGCMFFFIKIKTLFFFKVIFLRESTNVYVFDFSVFFNISLAHLNKIFEILFAHKISQCWSAEAYKNTEKQ